MSKYTIELRKICDLYTREEVENWFKSYNIHNYLLPYQYKLLESSNLFSKDRLAKKIVDNYYMREIGFETPALFAHFAKIEMEKIMEEKLLLLYTSCIEYDPLVNVDYTETFERNIDQSSSGTNKSKSDIEIESLNESSNETKGKNSGLSVSSDTPQGQINKNEILNGKYASQTTANENEGNSTSQEHSSLNSNQYNTSNNSFNSNANNIENYTRKMKGNQGITASAQSMVQQTRDLAVNIERDIIEELNVLFMSLY